MLKPFNFTAEEAKRRLIEGNRRFVASKSASLEASPEILKASVEGQAPYAVIVACSDSRIIPEAIFSAGIGDLFVVRVAGNVIDSTQLGSIEYAVGHLKTGLVVVLGHDNCGAVNSALFHHNDGYVKHITDVILKAVGSEKDEYRACCLNVKNSCKVTEEALKSRYDGLEIVGAVYRLETGAVEFL